jgi:hypothetical protein
MNYIASIIKGVWEWLVWGLTTMWDGWKAFNGFLWTSFLIIIGAIWVVLTNSVKWIMQTGALIDEFFLKDINNVGGASGPVTNILNLCNTFFPLEEAMSFLVVYLLFVTLIGTYHFGKSWIPTLSGSG